METTDIFTARRSVNFFDKAKPLNDKLLQQIIETGALAPSAFNLQPWRIIAVKSPGAKEKLCKLANNQPKILEAPVTLIMIGDKNGSAATNTAWNDLQALMGSNKAGIDSTQKAASALYGSSAERKLKFAESNVGLLAMSIMYAAKAVGVDSHPMSGMDFDGIKKEFGLDQEETAVMLIALGYFDKSKTLYPRRKRKSYSEIVKEL
jgi:nitroreductase